MQPERDPAIDWVAKIAAQERIIFKAARTPEVKQEERKIASQEHCTDEEWRVDWDAVTETEVWLQKEWAAGRRGYAGPAGAYDILPSAVPKEVAQIGGVLLARCAGYPMAPKPTDVVAAVNADAPTARERRALKTYLLEATGAEVKTACQAGEIDLRRLMQRVEEMIQRNGLYGLRSVEQWLTR